MAYLQIISILENIENSYHESIKQCIDDNNYKDLNLFKEALNEIKIFNTEFIFLQ